MTRRRKVPSYCRHKASGQAYVTLEGREHYLGVYGTPESRERYARLIAEHTAAVTSASVTPASSAEVLSVNELALLYWERHVLIVHVRDGKPTDRQYHIRLSLRPLKALYGSLPASEFGPKALKCVREKMIADAVEQRGGVNRRYVNDHIGIIKRMFRWGVAEELVRVEVFQALEAVENLRRGWDSRVREREKIKPVPDEHIESVLPHVPPQIAAMIQVQWATGMRPDEVTIMRPGDIDRREKVWLYVPRAHKLEHLELDRVIPLGPRAQCTLQEWLNRPDDSFLFSPREVVEEARRKRGQRTPKKYRNREPRAHYDDESYCQAVTRGCRRAGIPKWTPGQLRHNAATEIRQQYGIEAARLILGHQSTSTTEIYAEKNLRQAMEIMETIG